MDVGPGFNYKVGSFTTTLYAEALLQKCDLCGNPKQTKLFDNV